MPLVPYFKATRILKRSRRLKGRPAWQDADPGSKEGRDAYAIAAKYQSTFSKAFLEAIRGLITPEISKDFIKAYKTGSITAAVNSIPYFTENPEENVWEKFTDKLGTAYGTVIQAAGDDATRDLNKEFDVDLEFNTLPPEPEVEVLKSREDVRRAAAGMTVGVNPYSVKWIETRGLELVTQSITAQQKTVITNIIQDAMEIGARPTDALTSIKANIGLTARDAGAAAKRQALHLEAGLPLERANALTAKYQNKLLTARAERIARTETIAAQAQGRKAAWQVAKDSGNLPSVQRRWMAPPPSPNPNRPCEICLELDGKTAPLDEPYESLFIGPIEGPPAHPSCLPGNSAILAPGITALSKRWYDGDLVILTTTLGNKFSGTPNHPILGQTGWRPVKEFRVGDHVISSFGGDWIPSFIDRDHEDRPAPIHEVMETFRKTGHVTTVPVPTTSEDFHGDGTEGQIAIIRTNGLLIDGTKSAVYEKFTEQLFLLGARLSNFLNRVCPSAALKRCCFSSSCGFVRGLGVSSILLRRALRHHQAVSIAGIPNIDMADVKNTTDLRSGDSEGFGNRVLRSSSLVTLDDVVSVDVQRFVGHVFNLQSEFAWYLSQNLISHNCRCTESLERI